ncbi:MAG TPA: exopolysaccharide biosynthesis polyprenyl glycosylphosphotransferase [Candidatus Binatia bacterium]|jgi:exopolysaccharide biosynthesis polyprenyl glycosylphosphotransferase|nr:exopolysaccharide biosynthesis polyprenyl glycosylphosphotransferase [Candidatus Binatia bacterium]
MKPRITTLALCEIGVLMLTVCGTALLWAHSLHLDGNDAAVYAGQALIPALSFVTSSYYNNLYDLRIVSNFEEFGVRLPQTFGVAFLLTAALYAVFPHMGLMYEPFPAGLWGLLVIVGWVAPVRLLLCLILKSRPFAERVLIVGTNPLASTIAEGVAACSPISSTIIGFVTEETGREQGLATQPPSAPYPVLGSVEQLAALINETRPDRIIVALRERYEQLPARELIEARMAGIAVEDGIEVHEHLAGKLAVEYLTPSWLLFCKDFKSSRWQITWRRAFSLGVTLCGLLLTLPLMGLIALAIKLESSGPVFFLQERAGLRGKTFRLVKFRTMRPASPAEESPSSVWRRDDSARITRLGKWLRKLRLDELPQFINIIRGDMNLIGPRPEMASNVATMAAQIPYYSLRMAIRPGITGWAQVKHGYAVSQEGVTEKLRYDLYYAKHMSVWLDLRIAIDTVKILLCSPGSEEQPSNRPQPTVPPAAALPSL